MAGINFINCFFHDISKILKLTDPEITDDEVLSKLLTVYLSLDEGEKEFFKEENFGRLVDKETVDLLKLRQFSRLQEFWGVLQEKVNEKTVEEEEEVLVKNVENEINSEDVLKAAQINPVVNQLQVNSANSAFQQCFILPNTIPQIIQTFTLQNHNESVQLLNQEKIANGNLNTVQNVNDWLNSKTNNFIQQPQHPPSSSILTTTIDNAANGIQRFFQQQENNANKELNMQQAIEQASQVSFKKRKL